MSTEHIECPHCYEGWTTEQVDVADFVPVECSHCDGGILRCECCAGGPAVQTVDGDACCAECAAEAAREAQIEACLTTVEVPAVSMAELVGGGL